MLHKEAADANTWRVLEKLMGLDFLSDFHLCGGTSLALLYGHRLSIDIDLFTAKPFDKTALDINLREHFEEVNEVFTEVKIFYFTYLDKVKSDFVYSKPEVISDFVNNDGIRMWGLPDIMAMKLNAVYGRGSKKDFWDIDELLNYFPITTMVEFFFKKHPQAFEEGLMMSLLYFDDADEDKDPILLKPRKWADIKKRIEKEVFKSFRIRK